MRKLKNNKQSFVDVILPDYPRGVRDQRSGWYAPFPHSVKKDPEAHFPVFPPVNAIYQHTEMQIQWYQHLSILPTGVTNILAQ
jgi:hypothetical protein